MSTRLVTSFMAPGETGGTEVFVEEGFDDVMDKIWPATGPASAVEARGLAVFTKASDGKRVFVVPNSVVQVSEDEEETI